MPVRHLPVDFWQKQNIPSPTEIRIKNFYKKKHSTGTDNMRVEILTGTIQRVGGGTGDKDKNLNKMRLRWVNWNWKKEEKNPKIVNFCMTKNVHCHYHRSLTVNT